MACGWPLHADGLPYMLTPENVARFQVNNVMACLPFMSAPCGLINEILDTAKGCADQVDALF